MLSELRKTINVFGMIKDGDRIAVGLSGGKDSLAMLYLLHRYAMFSPQRFSLVAITIDMGLGSDFSGLTSFCKSINTEHVIVATEIGKIVFDERKEKILARFAQTCEGAHSSTRRASLSAINLRSDITPTTS